jgi:hypothetical protein
LPSPMPPYPGFVAFSPPPPISPSPTPRAPPPPPCPPVPVRLRPPPPSSRPPPPKSPPAISGASAGTSSTSAQTTRITSMPPSPAPSPPVSDQPLPPSPLPASTSPQVERLGVSLVDGSNDLGVTAIVAAATAAMCGALLLFGFACRNCLRQGSFSFRLQGQRLQLIFWAVRRNPTKERSVAGSLSSTRGSILPSQPSLTSLGESGPQGVSAEETCSAMCPEGDLGTPKLRSEEESLPIGGFSLPL